MKFNWREIGIQVGVRRGGDVKTICPNCSHTRANKRDKSLSANLNSGLFLCHHCGFAGKAKLDGVIRSFDTMVKKQYRKPNYKPESEPQDKLSAWFQARGISEAVVRRNRIETRNVVMPDGDEAERVIAFPYLRDGEIVNVQYRTADKRFKLEAGCELILYGLDDVQAGEPLIFCEGQMDKLALEEAGYLSCVSVPNGANISAAEWLSSAEAKLDTASFFILAGDNDAPGRTLQDELARRLGPEKCWRAEWPAGCKDANETLIAHGRPAVIEAIECAQPLPINGIVQLADLYPELEKLYRAGIQPGEYPGWDNLAANYRPRAGEWTMLTGAPGSGKSTFLDALMMNLALASHWRFALFSPEQMPLQQHAAQLLELWQGQPFSPGPTERMGWDDVREGVETLGEYFKFLQPEDSELTVDGILSLARACVTRYGINGLVIDPWNEIEHNRPQHLSETEYIGQSLSKIRRFARHYNLHIWILVHPTKLQKQQDGTYPVATPYDAAGSAHWFNKADMILSLWRNKTNTDAPLEVHTQKVRFRENGSLGIARLYYDRVTGRLSETAKVYRPASWHEREAENVA